MTKGKFKPTWEAINDKYNAEGEGEYSNVLHLVDLLLTIPIHSAQCERGFSRMKTIKTKLRNKLDSGSMTAILRIQLETAQIETFDPMPAVCLWNNSSYRARRPFQAPYGPRTKKVQSKHVYDLGSDSESDEDDRNPSQDENENPESDYDHDDSSSLDGVDDDGSHDGVNDDSSHDGVDDEVTMIDLMSESDTD